MSGEPQDVHAFLEDHQHAKKEEHVEVVETPHGRIPSGYCPCSCARQFHFDSCSPDEPLEFDTLAGEDVAIEEDVYGAFIFTCTYDISHIMSGIDDHGRRTGIDLNYQRLIFVCCCLICNFLLQIGMLYWIYFYVASTAVNNVQIIYQSYHAECFEDGVYSETLWELFPHKEALCGIAFSNFWFMFGVLCLWWLTVISELQKTEETFQTIQSMPSTQNPRVMVSMTEDGTNRLQALTRPVRSVLYIFMFIPKLFISIGLLAIGTVWLAATDSFSDLILNAVALEFVLKVDELFFEALIPNSCHSRLNATTIWKPSKKTPDEQDREIRAGYRRSYIYLFGIMFSVYSFLLWGQELPFLGIFPGFKYDADCPLYSKVHTRRICTPGNECFPFT